MSAARIAPVGTNTTNHGYETLDADTYTAHRLKHASPKHLHLTTRRFFIGPIPEGWLNSNRKSWYKKRLELSNYSSKAATFHAAANTGPHHRTNVGTFDGPSMAARMSFSFPQPEDVGEENAAEDTELEEDEEEEGTGLETRALAPVATQDAPRILGIADEDDPERPKRVPAPPDKGLSPTSLERGRLAPGSSSRLSKSPGQETFVTAHEDVPPASRQETFDSAVETIPAESRQDTFATAHEDIPFESKDGTHGSSHDSPKTARHDNTAEFPRNDSLEGQGSPSNNAGSLLHPSSRGNSPFPGEASSTTPLLGRISPKINPLASKSKLSLLQHDPAPVEADDPAQPLGRTTTGVRFKVAEGVANQQQRIAKRVDTARNRVANTRFRRSTLQEGTIVKMEKMLVRVDFSAQQIPDEYDENESLKTETRTIEKWREFMVVARRSKNDEASDFRVQMYKTRVIPEIDNEKTRKRPAREIKLRPKTTQVNLYSSLDKSVVIWHPYKKGTRMFIMKPRSTAHAVEWYTFLRDALGWKRPGTLLVNVPDLDVSLRLEKPFEGLEAAGLENLDEQTAIARAAAAEGAVAARIIKQCIDMIEGEPEWSGVLQQWSDTVKMGLAWKRYDRLEWIYGVNEQKMYGSMAMQQSHDLELRPKQHYPTTTFGKKGVSHEEPVPIEGFLIRLTSQKGIHQRLGKTFFKRLYFSTQNQFLIFNRPAKSTPPHPPRLATISGANIPSSHEIVEKTPTTFDITPFPFNENTKEISWLASGNQQHVSRHDREAFEEARRNADNLAASEGYINMCRISKVRKFHWGALPTDDDMESGSDIDFHAGVDDSTREDGTTSEIDEDRMFELLLDNGLVIRLQAYNRSTRDEWKKRLRKLVKYWKLRTAADMDLFKSVRKNNLSALNIDEEMEAIVGQFARKWEVRGSEASPQLYHMCGISSCRSITLSGLLYRKPRRHATFQRCGVILAAGQLLIYQASLRKRTGEQIKHIHQEKQESIDLRNCYVYSGLITEDDLLYQNRTFDSNHPGLHALPRVYLEDGWTSTDEDAMTCFVVWRNTRRGWFRATEAMDTKGAGKESEKEGGTRSRLRRVGQLGVPGRGMVFKCRSRAERDHWVLSVAAEIERVVEGEEWEVRFAT